MLEDLQIRHYSPTTIRLYLYAVRAFAKHFGKPPDQLGAEHIRRYQLFLTREKKVSTSTYVMMICGLRFFYIGQNSISLTTSLTSVRFRGNCDREKWRADSRQLFNRSPIALCLRIR